MRLLLLLLRMSDVILIWETVGFPTFYQLEVNNGLSFAHDTWRPDLQEIWPQGVINIALGGLENPFPKMEVTSKKTTTTISLHSGR